MKNHIIAITAQLVGVRRPLDLDIDCRNSLEFSGKKSKEFRSQQKLFFRSDRPFDVSAQLGHLDQRVSLSQLCRAGETSQKMEVSYVPDEDRTAWREQINSPLNYLEQIGRARKILNHRVKDDSIEESDWKPVADISGLRSQLHMFCPVRLLQEQALQPLNGFG